MFWLHAQKDKWSKTVIEQEQEAKGDASNAAVSSAIPEGSKETLGMPDVEEQTLTKKTSGYLEKMSKAILPSKQADTASTAASPTTEQGNKRMDGSDSCRVQKLPRVFHPLN